MLYHLKILVFDSLAKGQQQCSIKLHQFVTWNLKMVNEIFFELSLFVSLGGSVLAVIVYILHTPHCQVWKKCLWKHNILSALTCQERGVRSRKWWSPQGFSPNTSIELLWSRLDGHLAERIALHVGLIYGTVLASVKVLTGYNEIYKDKGCWATGLCCR